MSCYNILSDLFKKDNARERETEGGMEGGFFFLNLEKATVSLGVRIQIAFMLHSAIMMVWSRTEPETIDRGCSVQINKIFGSKEILFFIIRPLFFSEPNECPGAGWRLHWIRSWVYGMMF
jgi:hypothetical protein